MTLIADLPDLKADLQVTPVFGTNVGTPKHTQELMNRTSMHFSLFWGRETFARPTDSVLTRWAPRAELVSLGELVWPGPQALPGEWPPRTSKERRRMMADGGRKWKWKWCQKIGISQQSDLR